MIKTSIITLLRMARPQFLFTGVFLFLFGACWAILLGAPVNLPRILLGYLVFMPAHLSISYSNDAFDLEADRYGSPTLFSGGSGMLVKHPELRRTAKGVALGLIACSMTLGLLFQTLYSYPAWFLGLVVLGNLLGWSYSAPPIRLAYHKLGEPAMFLSIGLLIPGLGYLATSGHLDLDSLVFALPLTLYGLAFILTVENPDMEADRLGGKRTWVACTGRSFGFSTTGVALLLATSFFFFFPWLDRRTYPLDFHFLGILSFLPLGAGLIGWVRRPADKDAATRVVIGIIISLAVFCILADGYIAFLALR